MLFPSHDQTPSEPTPIPDDPIDPPAPDDDDPIDEDETEPDPVPDEDDGENDDDPKPAPDDDDDTPKPEPLVQAIESALEDVGAAIRAAGAAQSKLQNLLDLAKALD